MCFASVYKARLVFRSELLAALYPPAPAPTLHNDKQASANRQRGAIRWALMLCIESDGAVDPLEGMTAMAGVGE
jgi:hypothetical protein